MLVLNCLLIMFVITPYCKKRSFRTKRLRISESPFSWPLPNHRPLHQYCTKPSFPPLQEYRKRARCKGSLGQLLTTPVVPIQESFYTCSSPNEDPLNCGSPNKKGIWYKRSSYNPIEPQGDSNVKVSKVLFPT